MVINMKKLLLVIALSLVIFNVNAKEYDMNYGYFNESDKTPVYYSGDTYKNAYLNGEGAVFKTSEGKLVYSIDYSSLPGIKGAPSPALKYTVDIEGKNIYGISKDYVGDIKIPTYRNNNIFWYYYYPTPTGTASRSVAVRSDVFYPYCSVPKYEIVCDKTEIKYGETSTCTLKVTVNSYMKLFDMPDSSFNLYSEDYNISDVKLSRFYKYDNNTGKYVSNSSTDVDISDVFKTEVDASLVKYDDNDNIINKTRINSAEEYASLILNDEGTITESDLLYTDNTYMEFVFNALTFTITPKNEEMVKGAVYIKNITLNNSGEVLHNLDDVNLVLLNNKEIKQVEENPSTGVLDARMLFIVPIVLITIYVISKRSKFKRYV